MAQIQTDEGVATTRVSNHLDTTWLVATERVARDEPLLREMAQEADANAAWPADVANTWRRLLEGQAGFVDWFFSPARWFALYTSSEEDARWKPVPPHVRRLFDRLFVGERQKIAAFEQGVGLSTISVAAHRALEQIGLPLTACKAPAILMLLVRAGLGLPTPAARRSSIRVGAARYEVLSIARPELHLTASVPKAELHVLQRLVEGATYAQIAAERGTSRRTVANQVRGVFGRLAVTNRGELIARVLDLASAPAMTQSPARALHVAPATRPARTVQAM